jgi:hypothetical protein
MIKFFVNDKVLRILNLLEEISELGSNLYGFSSYYGHTNCLDLYVDRYPNHKRLINKSIDKFSLKDNPTLLEDTITELELILKNETELIAKKELFAKLKAELGLEGE